MNLPQSEIHVWRLSTNSYISVRGEFRAFFSEDELARADRFQSEHLRTSYLATRGALRHLLAEYTGVQPAKLSFHYGARGKPSLANETSFRFNVSRTHGFALLAFARNCELGVDVEKVRPIPDLHRTARRFFCSDETAELINLPDKDQQEAFFLCWSRKEAYVKAIGEGLFVPLDQVRVSLAPGAPARFMSLPEAHGPIDEWQLHALPMFPGYVSALAYRDRIRKAVVIRDATKENVLGSSL